MPQSPDWKRYLEAGMQFTELRRSQARALAADLVEQGQLARDQVANAVDEMIAHEPAPQRSVQEFRARRGAAPARRAGPRDPGRPGALGTQAERRDRDSPRAAKRANGTAKKTPAKRTAKAAPAKKKKATTKKAG